MNAWSEEAVAVPTGGPEADWLPFSIVPTVGESPREEIISALFRSEYAGLLRLAYCITGDRCSAEDVVMEAYCSLHVHWPLMRRSSAPLPYLRSAVILGSRSVIRQAVRSRHWHPRSEVARPDPSSEDAIADTEAGTLAGAVRALPHRQCEVIVCRYYLELSEAETAELLHLSVGAVKQHAHRARQTLSRWLEVER